MQFLQSGAVLFLSTIGGVSSCLLIVFSCVFSSRIGRHLLISQDLTHAETDAGTVGAMGAR